MSPIGTAVTTYIMLTAIGFFVSLLTWLANRMLMKQVPKAKAAETLKAASTSSQPAKAV